mmetsp:Transcript_28329/g.48105  ORF Transcript_28329/g.48105 Transcript_28329/m.48105 type:complete len:98 (-) Transcript_28329:2935-3228(-)
MGPRPISNIITYNPVDISANELSAERPNIGIGNLSSNANVMPKHARAIPTEEKMRRPLLGKSSIICAARYVAPTLTADIITVPTNGSLTAPERNFVE